MENNDKMKSALEAFAESIVRWTEKGDQLVTAIPGLSLFRRDAPTPPASYMYERSICLIVQGIKRVLLGDDVYVYDPYHFLITSVDLPVICQVIEASREKPYLSLILKLDRQAMSQLIADCNLPPPPAQQSGRGMAIGQVTLPLLTAFQRLIDLLAEPKDIPILGPIVQREIVYRLLVGEQGTHLRQMASTGSQSQQIAQARSATKAPLNSAESTAARSGHLRCAILQTCERVRLMLSAKGSGIRRRMRGRELIHRF